MAIPFLGLKMALLTIMAFLAMVTTLSIETPNTNSISHYNSDDDPKKSPDSSTLPSPLPSSKDLSPENKCRLKKEEMILTIIEHLKAPPAIKIVLEKSAKFAICVAGKFCKCLKLRFEPLILACFGVVGAVCMKEALSHDAYRCTLDCAKSLMVMNSPRTLDDKVIGGLCFKKCVK